MGGGAAGRWAGRWGAPWGPGGPHGRRRRRGRGPLGRRHRCPNAGARPVVCHAAGPLRALPGPGRPATRKGDLCRGRRRGRRSRLFRGGTSPWRARRRRGRTGAPADDQLAPSSACRRGLRQARHRYSPVAATDRSHRFWTTDRRGEPLACLRSFLPTAPGPRRGPTPLAARIAARAGRGERRF